MQKISAKGLAKYDTHIYHKYDTHIHTKKGNHMTQQFLVQGVTEGEPFARIMSPAEIFNMMDLSDCYDIKIDLYLINKFGEELTHCKFFNTWSNPEDPLLMWIQTDAGEVINQDYGTDH